MLPLHCKEEEEVEFHGSRKEMKGRWRLGKLIQYADDLMILVTGKTLDSVRLKAAGAFKVMSEWCLRNRLKLNSLKTHFMFVLTRQRATGKDTQSTVEFGDSEVTPSVSERILGITLESNLAVNEHLVSGSCSILSQVSTKMRALWMIRKHLSFKSRKVTAWGLVMSKILYGIEVWGPAATERQIEQMQSLQNSLIRWVCGAGRRTRSADLLVMTGMMSIRQLIMYRVLVFGLVVLWNDSPKSIKWRSEISRKLKTTTKSYRYFLGKMMVRLPARLLQVDPRKNKSEIKRWILNNIPPKERWEGLGECTEDSDEET